MWIALGIVGFLAVLITVILLLPVKVIIKNNERNEFIFRYKYLFKTFGENPNPDDPIVKALKSATGVDRLNKVAVKENISAEGLLSTVKESFSMLVDLLKEVLKLLGRCKVSQLHITIRCTGDGADEAAIHYGECSAVVYSLFNIVRSFLKVRKKGCKIDVGCDFMGDKPVFRYDVVLKVRAGRVLGALWRVALAEAKRQNTQEK
ncbi:MAG: hypothetical protein IJW41_02005 [Oscillospiraceae bacterium]|nr:hypothetical protein [Oscillospiraceae bacterium]